ncbi:hypothetical protein Cgig2_000115 [Carnegiea gigantea]|uniref:Ethylene insensitive 3-like DNA-binding domain-containing protein n=1 Tax=Carnegiea gigantea TaxID=171969 RepID=A0A9Q1L190_9CARY|nr:hypothetical protein Cgig2_000115 [Carnegiea gigantea]
MTELDEIGADYGSDMEVDDLRCGNMVEKDVSDEEIDPEELERRMWKDRIKLKRIKERQKLAAQQAAEKQKPKQTSDQARRKKMSRAQDGILKYMLKLMEVCKARGFVYGIIPETGKPVSGASDNIRAWWKEKVKFDKNGPAAIANDNGTSGVTGSPPGPRGQKRKPAVSSDSDYDVGGVDDGAGSVSSKDRRKNQQSDAEKVDESVSNNPPPVQKKNPLEKQTKRKKSRGKASTDDQQSAQPQSKNDQQSAPNYQPAPPSRNENTADEPVGHVPSDENNNASLDGYRNDTQQEHGTAEQFVHMNSDLLGHCHPPMTEFDHFNHFSSVPAANEITGQDIYAGGQHFLYPGVQHGGSYYHPSIQYEQRHDEHETPLPVNEQHTRPEVQIEGQLSVQFN